MRRSTSIQKLSSFTQAGLDLHVAQSALSRQVGRLERELGVELHVLATTRRTPKG
jgi:DNA-binding transcriptional LysR family regulator